MNAVFYIIGNSDLSIYDSNGKEYSRITGQEGKKINFNKKFRELTDKFTKINCDIGEGKLVFTQTLEYENINIKSVGFKIFDAFYKALNENADKIFLFYTDQKIKHPQDTVFCSELLAKYIELRYKKPCVKICIENDPWDFVGMQKFFENFIRNNKTEIDRFEKIYFQLTTGTPAMCINLALNLINYDTNMLYIKNDNGNSSAIFIDESYALHKKFINDQILSEIDNLNYTMAKKICENSFYRKNEDIFRLLSQGEKLLNFDYPNYTFEKKIRTVIARIKFSNNCGKYIESLALIVCLGENIMKNLLTEKARSLGLNMSEEDIKEKNNLKKIIPEDSYLMENNDTRYATKKDMRKVLENIKKNTEGNLGKKIDEFLNINDNFLIKCVDLRDESPYAHGLKGLTQDHKRLISETYEKLYSFYGKPENDFEKINIKIKEKLRF